MKAVYLEWLDSVTLDSGGWSDIKKEIMPLTPDLVKSVGWVLKETDDYVILVSHLENAEASGEFCIPKACIKKRRVIKIR